MAWLSAEFCQQDSGSHWSQTSSLRLWVCRWTGASTGIPSPAPAPPDPGDTGEFALFGAFGVKITGFVVTRVFGTIWWAIDQVGRATLGSVNWLQVKSVVYTAALILFLLIAFRCLDCLLRPLVYCGLRIAELYRFYFIPDDENRVLTVRDLEWRGPDTTRPVDNDYYRDQIRARDLGTRKPNHLVCELPEGFIRVTRTENRMKTVNRHGQLWEYDEVIAASSLEARARLERAPVRIICLCRKRECEQTLENVIHAKTYTGLAHHANLTLHGEVYSPTTICTGWCQARLHDFRQHLRKLFCRMC